MGYVISLMNEKGGVGKSSLTFSVASLLASEGNKVLIVDMDGQMANLTYIAGIKKSDAMLSMYDALVKGEEIGNCVVPSLKNKNLFIVPAGTAMADALTSVKLSRMKKLIKDVKNLYDYVFIDVSPSPDWKHALTLAVADYVCIVMLPDVMSLEANMGIVDSILEVKDSINPNLNVAGILLNQFDGRTNLAKAVKEQADTMANTFHTKVFDTRIRKTVTMSESIYYHCGVSEYAPKADVSSDVNAFVNELVSVVGVSTP